MRHGIQWKTGLGLAILAALIMVTGGVWLSTAGQAANEVTASSQTKNEEVKSEYGAGHAKALSAAFRKTANEVLPSVVMIRTTPSVAATEARPRGRGPSMERELPEDLEDMFRGSPFEHFFRGNPEMRRFFEQPRVRPNSTTRGIGSGVIIDESGLILTNNHVVRGGNPIVRLHDGREFKALDVKTDPKTDIAIVRIENAPGLKAARLGNSDHAEIGDWVLALGQPFGLQGTVTAGIISATGRGIGIMDRESFLQTDAAINPGNSGGPLVNLDGEIVGINTAISSTSGGNMGIGFAVPANLARWVADQLAADGRVQRSFLGVGIQVITSDLAKQFDVPTGQGVLVTEVRSDTPAEKAGLKPGDVIVEFAGRKVRTPQGLQVTVEQCEPGSKQDVVVLRDGKRVTLTAVLREQTEADVAAAPEEVESSAVGKLGVEVSELTSDVAQQLGLKDIEGVVITNVESNSLAAAAGLANGMVISEVNRTPVRSVAEFTQAVEDFDPEKGLLLLVRTEAGSRFLVIRGE